MKQFLYYQQRSCPFDVGTMPPVDFKLFRNPFFGPAHWFALYRCVGLLGMAMVWLKLASPNRQLYCALEHGEVVHYGWCSFSHCRYYPVQKGDVVIGPIWSDNRFRGRGFATTALQKCVNELILQGYRRFWIDTSEDNLPCIKVIKKTEFGEPVVCYEKRERG